MTADQCRKQFFRLARKAIAAGYLSARERDIICRPGTRKANYWARHYRDLQAVVRERLGKQQ